MTHVTSIEGVYNLLGRPSIHMGIIVSVRCGRCRRTFKVIHTSPTHREHYCCEDCSHEGMYEILYH